MHDFKRKGIIIAFAAYVFKINRILCTSKSNNKTETTKWLATKLVCNLFPIGSMVRSPTSKNNFLPDLPFELFRPQSIFPMGISFRQLACLMISKIFYERNRRKFWYVLIRHKMRKPPASPKTTSKRKSRLIVLQISVINYKLLNTIIKIRCNGRR